MKARELRECDLVEERAVLAGGVTAELIGEMPGDGPDEWLDVDG